jgi:hypothetical protein
MMAGTALHMSGLWIAVRARQRAKQKVAGRYVLYSGSASPAGLLLCTLGTE